MNPALGKQKPPPTSIMSRLRAWHCPLGFSRTPAVLGGQHGWHTETLSSDEQLGSGSKRTGAHNVPGVELNQPHSCFILFHLSKKGVGPFL